MEYLKKTFVYQRLLVLMIMSNCGTVALDLEPELAWDACKIPLERTLDNKLRPSSNFAPPSCFMVNRTFLGELDLCEVFTCRSRLAGSQEEIGYMSIRHHNQGSVYSGCLSYPRIPAFVQVLDLSYVWREGISADQFENVSDLKFIRSLILVGSETLRMNENVLRNLTSLECVNMDHNNNIWNPDGRHFLRRLLRVPTLKRLSLRHSIMFSERFSLDVFNAVPSNLQLLWLTSNNFDVDQIKDEIFETLHHLKGLDLSESGLNLTQLVRSDSLESLDLSGNELKTFPVTCYNKEKQHSLPLCPNLSRLDLSNNHISALDDIYFPKQFCLPNLTFLDLRRNLIMHISLSEYIQCCPSLRFLHLQFQSVDEIELYGPKRIYRSNRSSFQELHLENCNQLRFDKESTIASKREFFQGTPDVKKLFLDGSNLHLMKEETFLDVFGHLSRLHTLSLSNTNLEFVSAAVFARFPDMAVLILSDNSITSIPDGCFDSLTHLVHLDLSGNKIITMTELTFSASLRGGLTFADLSQNPLACSCELMWFRDWFFADRWLFNVSVSEYKCYNYHPELELTEFTLNKQACLLSREACSMIIFSCTVLVTTFTLLTLLFRYRWHLRLVFYEAFRGQSGVRKWRLQHGRFDHDVFVSYASEDFDWIRHRLMPQLEDRLHLRLCIHDRQFIPGKNIVDNIADCVESSKKVLMVFSKNFVRSQWCQFELAYCLSHVMEHEDALIVVCLDNVTSLDIMTSAMMAVLKTTTYIQWAEQADAVRSFWGRLEIALDEIMSVDEHAV